MTSIRSPFRYAGGKFYARKLILSYFPQDVQYYCEPFAGGGSIFFAKEKSATSVLNDRDPSLVLVYTVIRDQPEQLIDWLAGKAATRENHKYYKNEYQPTTDLERAGRWYYLNRISYSGIMNMPNCFWGYGEKYSMIPENWPRVIRAASEKLQDVAITNDDFEQTIENAPDGALLFVDPPYFNADQDKFYTISFNPEDHRRLANCLEKHAGRLRFLLTYDNCEDIREMYHWADNRIAEEWNYCISRTDDQKNGTKDKGKRKKGQEIFITRGLSKDA